MRHFGVRLCVVCRDELKGKNRQAETCGSTCRQALYRLRRSVLKKKLDAIKSAMSADVDAIVSKPVPPGGSKNGKAV